MSHFTCPPNTKYKVETNTYATAPDSLLELFEAVSQGAKRRTKNYTVNDALPDYTLCCTITTVDESPYLGSVAWARPSYDGFVRVATRYCVHPEWMHGYYKRNAPGKGYDNIRIDVVDHIDQQVDFCSKLGYENFFISREDGSPSARATKEITESINKYSKHLWNMLDEKQRVAPNPVTGWQYIIYNNKPFIKSEI